MSLTVAGSSAGTTIIDGGSKNTVVTIPNANAQVSLSKLTIRNGSAQLGGGINNSGALTITYSIISGNQAPRSPGRGRLWRRQSAVERHSFRERKLFDF